MDVHSVFRKGFNFFVVSELGDVGLQFHVVQREQVFSGSDLHNSGQVRHGVEEVRDTY
jgi:hypothetical protein